ncbi:hypothetical protein [Algiphilus sp.]|uniref:hypothetical protein n=1 Tax=Algiphilus sp. TaxID=1872431 RepID=UPI003B52EAF4
MQQRLPYKRLERLALWSLVLMLLVSTWPELEVHDAASVEHSDAAAHVHLEGADLWGDPEGLHVHACQCTAHCMALPMQLPAMLAPSRAPLVMRTAPHLRAGIISPPFRPPIA